MEVESETEDLNMEVKTDPLAFSDLKCCTICCRLLLPGPSDSGRIVDNSDLEVEVMVPLAEAITFIFNLKLLPVPSDLSACQKCTGFLSSMYKVHKEFRSVLSPESVLGSMLRKSVRCSAPTSLSRRRQPHRGQGPGPRRSSPPVPASTTGQGQDPFQLQLDAMIVRKLSVLNKSKRTVDEDELEIEMGPRKRKRYPNKKYTGTCPVCGKELRGQNKALVEDHVRWVHRRETDWYCSICDKPCCGKKEMLQHELTHLGKEEKIINSVFLCSQCGKKFTARSRLNLHLKTHDKSIQCDECDKKFSTKQCLERHKVIHVDDGVFPFKCDSCGECFKLAGLRREHDMYCTASERPFRCDLCEKRFKLNHHLNKHRIDVHYQDT